MQHDMLILKLSQTSYETSSSFAIGPAKMAAKIVLVSNMMFRMSKRKIGIKK